MSHDLPFPESVFRFREKHPKATFYVLAAKGFVRVEAGDPWEPTEVLLKGWTRREIAEWLDRVRAKHWKLSRVTGWQLRFNIAHRERGIAVSADIRPDADPDFIGPLMDIGPAFLMCEREYLRMLSTQMLCESQVRASAEVGHTTSLDALVVVVNRKEPLTL